MRQLAGGGLLLAQMVAATRVVGRLAATRGGESIRDPGHWDARLGRASVVVPVLNEQDRLAPCLDGLAAQGPEVAEILVVDGGSTDGTRALVLELASRDPRVRWIDASPVPPDWNGKAWGLQVGFERASPHCPWLLTVDADVRPRPGLVRALVARAAAENLASLSAATLQELSGWAEGLLHPAMLATLVYRFGSPGVVARRPADVQANGQCALFRRDALARHSGFASVRASRCEDVTIARLLVAAGERVGFAETDGLVAARMYASARETWRGWARSLPMRDRYTRRTAPLRLAEATLVQALPLPVVLACLLRSRHGATLTPTGWLLDALLLNGLLLLIRLGALVGMARAYPDRPGTYWLSPLADLPVAVQLWLSLLGRRHTWRGRPLLVDDRAAPQPSTPPQAPARLATLPFDTGHSQAGRPPAANLAAGGVV